MSLVTLAQETVAIVERGAYQLPSGTQVDMRPAVTRAVEGTRLYAPGDFADLAPSLPEHDRPPAIEVTGETTAEAARRLVEREGVLHVAAVNFASARNPGGGFLRGAKAQEEDLARCYALYT